jgi:excinuclease UvrABC helicase subunit UvrB
VTPRETILAAVDNIEVELKERLGVLEENGSAAYALERPYRRIDTAGNVFLCLLEKGFGLGHVGVLLVVAN